MSLITKKQLSLTIQTIKNLLSKKADKSELTSKIDRSEIKDDDALALVAELELVSPIAADDGAVYTDENGAMYSL